MGFIRWGLAASILLTTPASAQMAARLDAFLKQHLADIPNPGFSAVVVRGGEIIFQKGYGVEVAGTGRPMTAQSPVAIGSQTKSLTAVAMMRLVERGAVDLDAPVVRYLPWFKTADRRGSEITIRMLLHNTSGIPSEDRGFFSQDTDESAAEREVRGLSRVPLVRAPGKSFEYSNENWTVAGAVIAAVSGVPYSTFLEREVLRPLGMTRSSTALARFPEIGALWGHYAGADGVRPAEPRFLAVALAAGSELRVTAEDMGRYLAMLLRKGRVGGEQFLSERSVRELFAPGSVTTVDMPDMGVMGGKAGYAMGWVVMEADGRTIIQHGGDAVVMGSWTVIDTVTNTAASILYNGPTLDAYRYPSKVWVVNNLLHLAAGQPLSDLGRPKELDPTRNDYELPARLLDRYVGTYLSAEGQRLTIRRDAGADRLLLDMAAGPMRYGYALDFASEASAVLRNVSGAVVTQFLVTPGGQVTGLAGGVPGGVYRKRSEAEAAKIQEARSISGRLTVQLPRRWTVRWDGDAFEARDSADSSMVVRGSVVGGGAAPPGPAAAPIRSETIGRYEWSRRTWLDGQGPATRQRIALTTALGGTGFRLDAAAPPGRLTALLRDVVVPLLTTLELGAFQAVGR